MKLRKYSLVTLAFLQFHLSHASLVQFDSQEELQILNNVDPPHQRHLTLPQGTLSSYLFIRLNLSNPLHQKEAHRPLIPASVTKILSSHAALSNLGSDFIFRTKVYEGADTWVIEGDGDPLLSLGSLDSILSTLRSRSIKNQLNYMRSFFPEDSVISKYFDPYHSYNPGVSALSIKENLLTLAYRETTDSIFNRFWPTYYLNPSTQSQSSILVPMSIEMPSDKWNLDARAWDNLSKSSKRNFSQQIPLKDSMFTVVSAISESLNLENPEEVDSRPLSLIKEITSIKLSESMGDILYRSDNLAIELICAKCFQDSLTNNASSLKDYLLNTLNLDVDDSEILIDRCSGLSPLNKISANAFKEFLVKTALQKFSNKSFYKYFVKKDYNNKSFYQKTGYLSYVRGLAGILESNNGAPYIAIILINHPEYREILNRGKSDPRYQEALNNLDHWDQETRSYRDNLLANWIDEVD